MKNGIFFNSGCKKCEQDGVVFMVNVGKDRSYSLGWSNNHGMYDGDKNCDGKINFKNLGRDFDVTNNIMKNSFLIGCNHGLNDEHIKKMKDVFKTFLDKF